MAQAARLNLRLQKELKLLLTDPPPGASFPLLSSSSSLTTIDAQIKGPEGTVYSDGLFNAKIQIPERYPFQPPSVTFATPIYHPNIDTGGRICLDILNLPPKGAWQPSSNISTVLTSIGLLLSEPNPDDGLMCEASREFKYNRQAFDQKARSMTEKYARAAASGSVCDSHFQSPANPATPQLEVETSSTESKLQAFEFAAVKPEVRTAIHGSKLDANESVVSQKRLIGTSRKLSLESSLPACDRDAHKEGREVPRDQMEVTGGEKPLKDKGNKCNQNQEKLCGSRRKLSLGALSLSKNKSDIDVELVMANHCPSVEPKKVPLSSSGPFLLLSEKSCKQELHQNQDCILTDDNLKMGSKRLRQFGNKQSSDSMSTFQMLSEAKDEMVGTPQLLPSVSHTNMSSKPVPASSAFDNKRKPHKDMNDGMGNGYHDPNSKRLCLAGKKLSLGFRSLSQSQGNDNKENLVPQISEYNGIGSKHGDDIASHKTLDISRSEENNSNKHPHSLSVSSYPSKSLPKQHQAFKRTENQRHDIDITVATKQKKAEVLATPVESESVIVLDSEDSEEEKSIPAKSKPVLARKRLGKWRVTT